MIHQEMVLEIEHPGHGPVKMVGFPLKLSGTPCKVRFPGVVQKPRFSGNTGVTIRPSEIRDSASNR
jgi:hypothetical protein